jgi:hypothetical protein
LRARELVSTTTLGKIVMSATVTAGNLNLLISSCDIY